MTAGRDWFALFGKPPPDDAGSLHIDDSNVRNQAALDGQGIELSCRTLIRDDVTEGRLLAPFQESIGSFSYYLVEPVHSPLSRAARQLQELDSGRNRSRPSPGYFPDEKPAVHPAAHGHPGHV